MSIDGFQFLTLTALLIFAAVGCTQERAQSIDVELQCQALVDASISSRLPIPNVQINEAAYVSDSEASPDHCLLNAQINPRLGIDGQRYATRLRLRMPATNWNGRLYMRGGGGINGRLVDPAEMLQEGYATLGTDSGHDSERNFDENAGGAAAFGVDPEARLDFAYRSYDQVVQIGKSLLHQFYDESPAYSYFEGCSEGGREALLMAQRFPEHFDGIIAGAPTIHLPLGPLSGVYTTQLFAGLAARNEQFLPSGEPAIAKTYSDSDLMLIRGAILAACDALDGLDDGIVDDLQGCTSPLVDAQLAQLSCKTEKNADCLSLDQIQTMQLAFAGPVDSKGNALYSDWQWDGGISGYDGKSFDESWRRQWLGPYQDENLSRKLIYATPLAVLYSTPPKIPIRQEDSLPFSLDYDFDNDVDLIYARNDTYQTSGADLFADATDLTGLHEKGGKLMVYHGASDAAVSMNDTLNWYRKMSNEMGGADAEFARLYLIPGMGHCGGGPATDSFNMLPELVKWVELGVAPDGVLATATNPGYFGVGSRTRVLCPIPKQARYDGSGSIDESSNFTCESPREVVE